MSATREVPRRVGEKAAPVSFAPFRIVGPSVPCYQASLLRAGRSLLRALRYGAQACGRVRPGPLPLGFRRARLSRSVSVVYAWLSGESRRGSQEWPRHGGGGTFVAFGGRVVHGDSHPDARYRGPPIAPNDAKPQCRGNTSEPFRARIVCPPTDGTPPCAAVRLARSPSAPWDFHSYVARPGGRSSVALEDVGVRPRADQVEIVSVDFVDQQPVRFDVAIAMMFPVAGEGVVFVSSGQGASGREHLNQLA